MHKKTHLLFSIALTALIVAAPHPSLAENKGGGGFDPGGYKGGGKGNNSNQDTDPMQDRSGNFDTTDRSGNYDNRDRSGSQTDYQNGSQGGFKPGDPNLSRESFLNNVGIYNGNITQNDVESTVGNVNSVNDLLNEIKGYKQSGVSNAVDAAKSIPGANAAIAVIGIHSDTVSYQSDISAYYNNGNHIEDLGMAVANATKVGMDAVVLVGETVVIIGAVTGAATVTAAGTAVIAGTAVVATAMTLAGLVGTFSGNLYAMFVDNKGNQYLVPVQRNQESPQDRYDRRGGDGNRPGNPRGGL